MIITFYKIKHVLEQKIILDFTSFCEIKNIGKTEKVIGHMSNEKNKKFPAELAITCSFDDCKKHRF